MQLLSVRFKISTKTNLESSLYYPNIYLKKFTLENYFKIHNFIFKIYFFKLVNCFEYKAIGGKPYFLHVDFIYGVFTKLKVALLSTIYKNSKLFLKYDHSKSGSLWEGKTNTAKKDYLIKNLSPPTLFKQCASNFHSLIFIK